MALKRSIYSHLELATTRIARIFLRYQGAK